MYRQSEAAPRGAGRWWQTAVAAVLLPVSLGSSAGLTPGNTPRDEARPAARPAAAAKAPKAFQLRCWQYGRLLFEEYLPSLPAESRTTIRLAATDRTGQPLQIVETQTATCLIRSSAASAEDRSVTPGAAAEDHGR